MKRKNYLIKTLIAGIFVGEIIFFAGCFGDVEWFALFGCITMLISLALLIVFVIVKVIKKLLCRFSSKQNEASTGNAEVATQSNDSIGETITEKSDSECSEWATAFLASSFISALSEVLSSDLDLALFVAYDEDFNDRFPFIDTDGFIEVCTYREEAEKLKSHYLEHHLGHISIREITGNHKILETFKSYLEMGIRHMRFHHYDDPMEICLTNIVNPDSNNLLEIRNVSTRAQFLRELQP